MFSTQSWFDLFEVKHQVQSMKKASQTVEIHFLKELLATIFRITRGGISECGRKTRPQNMPSERISKRLLAAKHLSIYSRSINALFSPRSEQVLIILKEIHYNLLRLSSPLPNSTVRAPGNQFRPNAVYKFPVAIQPFLHSTRIPVLTGGLHRATLHQLTRTNIFLIPWLLIIQPIQVGSPYFPTIHRLQYHETIG